MLFAIPSILLLLLFLTVNSRAQDNNINCPSSSCGNLRISYPFRLTSSPKSCGYDDPSFELECRNNQTIFKVRSRMYMVRDINYEIYSIWVVDPSINRANLSSCPVYSNAYDSWTSIFWSIHLNRPVSFLHCVAPVNSPKYVEAPFCGNTSSTSSQIYSYVMEGDGIALSESCTLDRVVWSSGPKGRSSNPSLGGIYGDLSDGVELSWFRIHCGECSRSNGDCGLEGSRITCKHQCKDDRTTLSQQGFKCQLEYWAPYIVGYGMFAYGGLIGLRFLIGFVFLMVLVVSQWRKRHHLPL
ncbi:RING-H2 finger protein ATL22-like [Salvia miltiorrhiza]|uniref:RING-H2 finger protein ATL22-like n=1 Tax=Salvia miltiorrhiza TaxID=226208 RepID=UPI0025AB795A|nr:RING-H2 finger protein ATL22-like [Salvia miltiorrhiza]